MHRIVESIEDNEPWFFYFFYSNDESEASRRLERFTAVESQPSCKVGGLYASVCFCLSHRTARETYNRAIQMTGKKRDVCFVKKCFAHTQLMGNPI
jgi:hypothetical protein